MSGRPQSAAVYRRRRFVLLTIVVVLVWAVVKLWPSGGDDADPTASPTVRASASSSTPASATPAPQKTLEASDTTTVSLPAGTAACSAEDVRIVPSVASGQRARQAVALDLAVSTSADKPCIFTAKASTMLAVISAGKTAVWDSSVCKASVLPDPVSLSPQWSTVVRVSWNARGSGLACARKEGWATPGKYTLEIGTLGGEPGQTTFTLAQPVVKPKPTRTPTSKATKTPSATPTKKPSAKPSATPSAD